MDNVTTPEESFVQVAVHWLRLAVEVTGALVIGPGSHRRSLRFPARAPFAPARRLQCDPARARPLPRSGPRVPARSRCSLHGRRSIVDGDRKARRDRGHPYGAQLFPLARDEGGDPRRWRGAQRRDEGGVVTEAPGDPVQRLGPSRRGGSASMGRNPRGSGVGDRARWWSPGGPTPARASRTARTALLAWRAPAPS